MEINKDSEMPRIRKNLSQLLEAGNQLWNRTVGNSPNRDVSEIKASVLLGARGYDYQKVSRNLDNLVSKGVKNYLSKQLIQPNISETDIPGFLRSEREKAIIALSDEIKVISQEQVEKQYWHNVMKEFEREKLELLDAISGVQELKSAQPIEISEPKPDVSEEETIMKKAEDCEKLGQFEEAVELYASIAQYPKAIKILIDLLSVSLSVKSQGRDKLQEIAIKIANCPDIDGPQELIGTFYLLLDLLTFFDYYHANQYDEALDTIQKLQLLPFTLNKVESKVSEFNTYPEEVRRNIYDILIATMNILHKRYTEQRDPQIRQAAKALIAYSGAIPYKMPSNAMAQLIELEVLID